MAASTMDRRAFVTGAAALGAGAAVAGLAGGARAEEAASADALTAEAVEGGTWSFETAPDPVPEDQITQTYEADIIVIGAGVSGLVTAASATEEGADVILFAASSNPVSRGGSNHGIGTKVQERLGVEDYAKDTITHMFKQEFTRNGYRIDQKRWWKWVNNSADTMNWLIDIMENAGYITTMEIGYEDVDGTFTAKPGSHNWIQTADGSESGAAVGENYVISTLAQKILD